MEIFDKLKDHIGEKVIIYYYHGSTVFKITDVLREVDDYTGVTIGNIRYPFINKSSGIGTISTLDGKIVYDNSIINEAYECANDEELEEYKKQMFGEDYQEEKKAYSLCKHTVKPKNSKEDIN